MAFYVYAACLAFGLIFAIGSAIAGHLFGGHVGGHVGTGGHTEAGFGDSGIDAMSFFSPASVASFVTAFGGFGIVFSSIEATKSPWISAPLSLAVGAIVSTIVVTLFSYVIRKSQSSTESSAASMVGAEATIVTPIPENGIGEIAFVSAGSRMTAAARSETGEAIGAGKPVKITRIVGHQFFVTISTPTQKP